MDALSLDFVDAFFISLFHFLINKLQENMNCSWSIRQYWKQFIIQELEWVATPGAQAFLGPKLLTNENIYKQVE